jgi:hypothetical protein
VLAKVGLELRPCRPAPEQPDPEPNPEVILRDIGEKINSINSQHALLARHFGIRDIAGQRVDRAKDVGPIEIKPESQQDATTDKTPAQKPKNK